MNKTIPMGALALSISLLSASAAHAVPKFCEDTDWHAQNGASPECMIPNITNDGGPDIRVAQLNYSEAECDMGSTCTRLDMKIGDAHYARQYCDWQYGQTDFMCYASMDLVNWVPFNKNDSQWFTGISPVTALYCECI